MDLRQLRYFLAVAEELHFARAAEKLHIDQSPLSRTIKELEEDLGVRLFVRTTRSTQLTHAGQALLHHMPRIFTALDQARDAVSSAENGFKGLLRIALSDSVTPSRLPALLARCREEDPDVEVKLYEVPLERQIKGLHEDLYDAGFTMADEVGDGIMITPAWEDEVMVAVTYLHAAVSTRRYPLAVPEVPFHIDALITDSALVGGLAPMLGDRHLRVVSVRGFPTSTWPGILDDLNRLGFAYRWSTRFLCLDKSEAERELVRLRRQWFAKRKNVIALLRETIFQQESPLVDTDANNKAADADAALQELGSDQVAFGYLTATVTVMDEDAGAADEKLRMVERAIQGRGFVTIPETLNAVDAWLSSHPGNAYANVRQPIVSTLNLAHMMPVSAVWAGPERNAHLDGPPLIVTRTDGATPFRLVTHIGDVGHTLVAGPTGMGKSVLLATLAMQFRRYPGSRIFAFDMGRSMRATVLGLGGEHYDLGTDGEIAFQPLARIDREGYRTWAAEWIEGRLLHEGVAVGPDEKAAIWSALGSLAGAPVEQRTMTGLSVLLQSNALRQALAPYVLGGAHGKLLDADHDRLGSADVQCFEMEELMHSKAAVMAVLHYLFARFDERFDGAPTLLILDEAWLFLDDPVFAARIRQWLKTLRKKNVSVIFATQSLADIKDSSIAPAIIESCASRVFLPNPQATEPQIRTIYQGFGLHHSCHQPPPARAPGSRRPAGRRPTAAARPRRSPCPRHQRAS